MLMPTVSAIMNAEANNFGFSLNFPGPWLGYLPDAYSTRLYFLHLEDGHYGHPKFDGRGAVIRDLTIQILTIPSLRGLQWDLSSPEVIEQVMVKIITAFGTPDPF